METKIHAQESVFAVWFKVESEKREQSKCSTLEIWLCKLRYTHVIKYYAVTEVKYGNSY